MSLSFNIFDTLPRACWVEIDADQLAENVRRVQKIVERPVLVAVKGNGYGHGYEIAAKAFLKGGAKYLGVANYGEGYVLKQLGIEAPVLILGGLLPDEMKLAAQAGLEFFVFRKDHVDAVREMAKGTLPLRVHIKVDTGMGRLGCFPEEVASLGAALKEIPGVTIAGLATHFAMAGEPNVEPEESYVGRQTAKFEQAIKALADIGIRPEIIHAGKSGTIYNARVGYDMVRLGIIAYGALPVLQGFDMPEGVNTALTWHARVTSSKVMPAGAKISYGCEYEMPKEGRVGILPVGYVDGYHRIPKNVNSVLIDGKEHKILGRINMDQCIVDLGDLPDMTGAEAILLGKQGGKEISVQDLASRWETNSYGVYSGIATRVPRRVKA